MCVVESGGIPVVFVVRTVGTAGIVGIAGIEGIVGRVGTVAALFEWFGIVVWIGETGIANPVGTHGGICSLLVRIAVCVCWLGGWDSSAFWDFFLHSMAGICITRFVRRANRCLVCICCRIGACVSIVVGFWDLYPLGLYPLGLYPLGLYPLASACVRSVCF